MQVNMLPLKSQKGREVLNHVNKLLKQHKQFHLSLKLIMALWLSKDSSEALAAQIEGWTSKLKCHFY